MQHDAANHLHPKGAQAQGALTGLAYHGKGFRQHLIQRFAVFVTALEFFRFGGQLRVRQLFHLRLQRVDLVRNFHQGL